MHPDGVQSGAECGGRIRIGLSGLDAHRAHCIRGGGRGMCSNGRLAAQKMVRTHRSKERNETDRTKRDECIIMCLDAILMDCES